MSHIKTGEKAYTRTNTASLYNSMPAFWKNTTIRNLHKLLSIIKTATCNESNSWIHKPFILSLAKFVEFSDVPKLRICHQVVKHDPSIIAGPCLAIDDNESDNEDLPPSPVNPITIAIVPYNPTTSIVPYNPTTAPSITATDPHQRTLTTFLLKPQSLVTAITTAEDTNATRMELFNHMVTFRHRIGFAKKKQKVI